MTDFASYISLVHMLLLPCACWCISVYQGETAVARNGVVLCSYTSLWVLVAVFRTPQMPESNVSVVNMQSWYCPSRHHCLSRRMVKPVRSPLRSHDLSDQEHLLRTNSNTSDTAYRLQVDCSSRTGHPMQSQTGRLFQARFHIREWASSTYTITSV